MVKGERKPKSCMFCDNPYASVVEGQRYSTLMANYFFVSCGTCGAAGPRMQTEDQAIDAWDGVMRLRKMKQAISDLFGFMVAEG